MECKGDPHLWFRPSCLCLNTRVFLGKMQLKVYQFVVKIDVIKATLKLTVFMFMLKCCF